MLFKKINLLMITGLILALSCQIGEMEHTNPLDPENPDYVSETLVPICEIDPNSDSNIDICLDMSAYTGTNAKTDCENRNGAYTAESNCSNENIIGTCTGADLGMGTYYSNGLLPAKRRPKTPASMLATAHGARQRLYAVMAFYSLANYAMTVI
ncbi:MAG: hypothetical protein OEZ13_11500 [Spirochaetia bacterium]|nr:hypothetical protein [Spirochaetia bacterium]